MNSRELSIIRLLKTKGKEKMTNPRLRNPSAKKDWKKFETPRHKNHPNTGLRDPSKTFLRFRDWAKIEAHVFPPCFLNASWRDRVTKAELYGDLPTLSVRIGFRRLGLTGHCHRPRELPPSQLVLWRPTHGHLGRTRLDLNLL